MLPARDIFIVNMRTKIFHFNSIEIDCKSTEWDLSIVDGVLYYILYLYNVVNYILCGKPAFQK